MTQAKHHLDQSTRVGLSSGKGELRGQGKEAISPSQATTDSDYRRGFEEKDGAINVQCRCFVSRQFVPKKK